MWAFAIVEERDGTEAKYILSSACDFLTAKQTMLSYLALIVSHTRLGLMADTANWCQTFLDTILNDGNALNELDDAAPWAGAASDCSEHERPHRMTYWIKQMSNEDFTETKKLFGEQFPEGDILAREAEDDHTPAAA